MKVLLIGGTGQISTGIVKALAGSGGLGADVTVFNRGKTDDRLPVGVKRMHGDRNEFGAFEKQMQEAGNAGGWDAVIDMICFKPEQAESAVRAFAGKVGHFVFCSTVCAYGDTQRVIPTTEATPMRPESEYGRNKWACEEIFLRAYREGKFGNGAGVTVLRPSHTFGPGGGIINNLGWGATFVDRLRKGLPIVVSGDGHGLWASAFSEDVGVGFAHTLGRKGTFGEAYNIVGDEVVTWDQYTRRTAAAIGAPEPVIVHIPTDVLLALDGKRYVALAEIFRYHGIYSNEKLRKVVPEYVTRTPYAEAVRRTVGWMEEHGRIKGAETDDYEDKVVAAWERMVGEMKRKVKGVG